MVWKKTKRRQRRPRLHSSRFRQKKSGHYHLRSMAIIPKFLKQHQKSKMRAYRLSSFARTLCVCLVTFIVLYWYLRVPGSYSLELRVESVSGRRGEPEKSYGHPISSPTPAGTLQTGSQEARRSFTIDYDKNVFLKDGKPFRYIAGAMHYFRVPSPLWRDRLLKYKAGGLNAVETYVEWSGHEPEPGSFNFEGDYDIRKFLGIAQDVGLLVVFRPGPYICAERDNGGLPYWLLRSNREMKLRTSDKSYLKKVDRWLGVLLPMIRTFLYENGGPIITVQVENEYGSYRACDKVYMAHLVDVFRMHLGGRVPLFTTDGAGEGYVKCGGVDGALATVDFGGGQDVEKAFKVARRANKDKGPLVVSEFYTGWLDHWGERHVKVNNRAIVNTLDEILRQNASVAFYMFHGGTNFGFSNGANPPPQPTSYDYSAPLSEAGDPRDLYFKIREVISRYETSLLPAPEDPKPAPKMNYGEVKLTCGPSLDDVMDHFRKKDMLRTATARSPISFEKLGQDYGYVAYKSVVSFESGKMSNLRIPVYRDRAYIIIEDIIRVIDALKNETNVMIPTSRGSTLTIVVENTGRINFESRLGERKGILSDVTLNGKLLGPWTMEAVPITRGKDISELLALNYSTRRIRRENCRVPRFYFGRFTLPEGQQLLDTFLDPTGWTKGVAFVNGFNLGRYWPVTGPQVTLYVPCTLLRPYPEENNVALLEMEGVDSIAVKLTDVPKIDGTSKKPESAIK